VELEALVIVGILAGIVVLMAGWGLVSRLRSRARRRKRRASRLAYQKAWAVFRGRKKYKALTYHEEAVRVGEE
jgi:hypothetical protein